MRTRTIVTHVAIVLVAIAVGFLTYASYGFECTYEKMPFGSSCGFLQAHVAFLKGAAPAVACLYILWGAARLMLGTLKSR
jgi:hypothetical protein